METLLLYNILLSFWKIHSILKYCGEPLPAIIFSLVFQFVAKGFATRHLTYRPSPKSTYSSKCSKGELILKHNLTSRVLFFLSVVFSLDADPSYPCLISKKGKRTVVC